MKVWLNGSSLGRAIDRKGLRRRAKATLDALGYSGAELSLTLVSDEAIAAIAGRFGREERPTPETRAGLQKVRFHDLRHTEATLLLTEGVHPKVVQERLGHATIAITLDTYSHVVEGMQREAAHRLDIPLEIDS